MMVMAVAALTSNAQESKYYVGGSLGYSYGTNSEVHSLTIAPDFGYVLSKKWDLGFAVDYTYAGGTHYIGLNPYARYTFLNFGRVALFADGGFSVAHMTGCWTPWSIGIKPGLKVTLTPQLCFVAHLGMIGYEDWDGAPGKDNKVGFNFDSTNLKFGLFYNF